MNKPNRDALKKMMLDFMGEPLEEQEQSGMLSYSAKWEVESPYGIIDVTFFNARDHRGNPWLACKFREWNAPKGTFNWYGWNHWKQNCHPALLVQTTPKEAFDIFRNHLENLQKDQGQGFPDLTLDNESK